jgi:DNA-binding GntR family transcriptional regulator
MASGTVSVRTPARDFGGPTTIPRPLSSAILTNKFRADDKLPSRNELAKTYDVAPMTVQNALRELREEGLIVSRQGSGVFVRERTETPGRPTPQTNAPSTPRR